MNKRLVQSMDSQLLTIARDLANKVANGLRLSKLDLAVHHAEMGQTFLGGIIGDARLQLWVSCIRIATRDVRRINNEAMPTDEELLRVINATAEAVIGSVQALGADDMRPLIEASYAIVVPPAKLYWSLVDEGRTKEKEEKK